MIKAIFGKQTAIHLHPWQACPREQASIAYRHELETVFGTNILDRAHAGPLFHLVILGMGEDGHTASLFSQHDIIHGLDDMILLTSAPSGIKSRMSLSPYLLASAQKIIVLIKGATKLQVLTANIYGQRFDPIRWFFERKNTIIEVYACIEEHPAGS